MILWEPIVLSACAVLGVVGGSTAWLARNIARRFDELSRRLTAQDKTLADARERLSRIEGRMFRR